MSLTLILIYEVEESNLSTYSNTISLLSLFISAALLVRKYYWDVDVCTKVFM